MAWQTQEVFVLVVVDSFGQAPHANNVKLDAQHVKILQVIVKFAHQITLLLMENAAVQPDNLTTERNVNHWQFAAMASTMMGILTNVLLAVRPVQNARIIPATVMNVNLVTKLVKQIPSNA